MDVDYTPAPVDDSGHKNNPEGKSPRWKPFSSSKPRRGRRFKMLTRDDEEWYKSTYLQSEHWFLRRNMAVTKAGGKCEDCGYKKAKEVHHLSYERLYCEADGDLVALCSDCHKARHHGKRV